MKFEGCYSAIVTPFKDQKVDYKSLEKLLNFQLNSKITGIIPCGSTGEGSSMEEEEYLSVIDFVIRKVNKKKQVIAGCGTNSTYKTLKIIEKLNKLNLDGILVVAPYYNKPTQRGIIEHFKEISQNTSFDIIVYNIPSRTGINIQPLTIYELSKIKNIVAVKEASGNVDQVSEIVNLCKNKISVLSGDDSLTLAFMSVGANGVISVASNIIPDEISKMCNSFKNGNLKEAISIHHRYFNFIKSMFIETNPIPIKYILKKFLLIENDELRLPLTRISKENAKKIDELIEEIKIKIN